MTGLVLFAGGGGSCQGLRQAGLDLGLGVEWDRAAVQVAQAAGLEHTVQADVRDASLYREGMADVLWSSFPCQAWSTAGKRKGAQDERNMWPATVDVVDHVQPRWVIAENVRGLTFHRGKAKCGKGKHPQPMLCPRCYLDHVIIPQLSKRYAWVDWRVLDSADYGTPQHRRRLFVVAGPRPIVWPSPTHSDPAALTLGTQPWVSLGAALGLQGYTLDQSRNTEANQERPVSCDAEPCVPIGTKGNQYIASSLRAIGGGSNPRLPGKPEDRSYRDLTDEPCVTLAASQVGNRGPWLAAPAPTVTAQEVKGTRAGPGGDFNGGPDRASDALAMGTGYAVRKRRRREEPAPTIAAGHGGKGCGQLTADAKSRQAFEAEFSAAAGGPGRRRLTVQECRVLMGWPPCYDEVLEGVTKTAAYRILGNGVDPEMARLLGVAVAKADR